MVAYSFKKRFVWPIKVGLGTAVPDSFGSPLPKLQTIRADRKRHALPGEEVQHYCGMRTKNCFLIGRARCTAVSRIIIWTSNMAIMVDGKLLSARQIANFALADGFSSIADMHQFWTVNHPNSDKFEGVLIQWTPLN